MDRTWLTKRVSSKYLGADGGMVSPTITTSSEDEWLWTEERFKDYLRLRWNLSLERKYDRATVRFSYKDSHPEYKIAAYRVDWEFLPNHISNHKDVLYYALLDMQIVDFGVITEVLGNRAYLNKGINQVGIWNILSENPHLKDKWGRYTTYPDPMLAEVALAIGLKNLESKIVVMNSQPRI